MKPSGAALKAIVDLQTAVNANDYANVPAKVAAAQAVAKTKEDRYIIAQLHLKAALAAKDNAGMAAAIDAVASSGYRRQRQVGASSTEPRRNPLQRQAVRPGERSASKKRSPPNPNDSEALIMLGETRNAQGRKAEAVAHSSARSRSTRRRRPEAARGSLQARRRPRL